MCVLGLDIGGANLKAALSDGTVRSRAFALWKHPDQLSHELKELLRDWTWSRAAVTMTGELCDCFATKREGVRAILLAANEVLGSDFAVWTTDGKFISAKNALDDPLACAASNWLALATFAPRFAPRENGIIVDVGSTTTDIIAFRSGYPAPRGCSDTERLQSGELVYTGAKRTPVCAILGFSGFAEFFADTRDVNLVLRQAADDAADCDTADGRPATRPYALARLARMVGGDVETIAETKILALARRVFDSQVDEIGRAVRQLIGNQIRDSVAIVSGTGEHYARLTTEGAKRTVVLSQELGSALSAAAPAYAVAVLAAEAA